MNDGANGSGVIKTRRANKMNRVNKKGEEGGSDFSTQRNGMLSGTSSAVARSENPPGPSLGRGHWAPFSF